VELQNRKPGGKRQAWFFEMLEKKKADKDCNTLFLEGKHTYQKQLHMTQAEKKRKQEEVANQNLKKRKTEGLTICLCSCLLMFKNS
jgi:hypothetical protein